MPPLEGAGTVASIGYASGSLFKFEPDGSDYRPSGDPAVEARRLHEALADSAAAISMLIEKAGDDTAAILEFQVAMLEDDALTAPALAEIETGADAAAAWTRTLNAEIAGYEAAEDAYFRARSADLVDIRDRVLRALSGAADLRPPAGAILFGGDLTPTQFLSMDWALGGGIVLTRGSAASHVAMLARARGVPMLIGVGNVPVEQNDFVLVDAEHGRIVIDPGPEARDAFVAASASHRHLVQLALSRLGEPAVTRSGERIDMLLNIAGPGDIDGFDIAHCDGIGLMRTEFLFGRGLPDEQTQYEAYSKVLKWARGKPVTIRTVDAGGDKPVPGLTVEESNPFLGLRGIRLSLSRPDVFRVQIRALLRAAVHGTLKVMFPMVSVPGEYRAALDLFTTEAEALTLEGVAHRMPPLGIMVEVPAVAIHPEPFGDVGFFSIGSNDLTQYVMAAGRDSAAVAALNNPTHPAVLSLIGNVTAFGVGHDIPVSLCGDAGGDPAAVEALLGAGLRSLSVAIAQFPMTKAAISRVSVVGGRDGKA